MTPSTTLVLIPVPPEEAKARMVRARQVAKTAKKQVEGLAKFAPDDKRTAKKIAEWVALMELNDRIAIGCKVALDELVIAAPEPITPDADSDDCKHCGNPRNLHFAAREGVGFSQELFCVTANGEGVLGTRYARNAAPVSVGAEEGG